GRRGAGGESARSRERGEDGGHVRLLLEPEIRPCPGRGVRRRGRLPRSRKTKKPLREDEEVSKRRVRRQDPLSSFPFGQVAPCRAFATGCCSVLGPDPSAALDE